MFAFKGHQFVGGFNEACSLAFIELEKALQPVSDGQHGKTSNFSVFVSSPNVVQ